LTKEDKILEEAHIDEDISAGPDTRTEDEGLEPDAVDSPVSDRNMADSNEMSINAGGESKEDGTSGDDEAEKETKRHKKEKSAKRTSRKELVELISNKNELLIEMETRLRDHEKELKNKEDKLLRIAAEFENYKKRTRREWELLEKRAKAELITDILGVLDDFDRALEALGERDDHVADGVVLIVTSLKDVLKRAGLGEVEALGQQFDPQFHEAIGETEDGEVEEGAVAHVVQKGYRLNGVLIRPAKVIVSKKK
jgi:molecular chaperone GrpE